MVSGLCRAQYSNHQLYLAYLEQDMSVWEAYIASTEWSDLTVEEKKQLLNYEYGFTAYALAYETQKAGDILSRYEMHVRDAQSILSKAEYLTHMAAISTYRFSLEKKLRYATSIYNYIKQAAEEDDDNPFVVEIMGNVEYYSPFGTKKKALQYFQQADSLYTVRGKEYHQWNLQAVRQYIEQIKSSKFKN